MVIAYKCSVSRACPFPGPFARQSRLFERLFLLASTGSSELQLLGYMFQKENPRNSPHVIRKVAKSLAILSTFYLSESSHICFI